MKKPASLARFAFALAVASALGVGTAAAFPAAARSDEAAVCFPGTCYHDCKDYGWPGGTCVNGYCECWQ
jgi:hypothetical protein